jgi:hypothetical protein
MTDDMNEVRPAANESGPQETASTGPNLSGKAPEQRVDRPYDQAATTYYDAGWHCVLPIGPHREAPSGFTGYQGQEPTPQQIAEWCAIHGHNNIGIRMPVDVIGIDVDAYDEKNGASTKAQWEGRLGVLPGTWKSSARGGLDQSGIYWYRVPVGLRWRSDLGRGSNVEIIRHDHRYAFVWPSTNHRTGTTYRWYAPRTTAVAERIPRPDELTKLPDAWVNALTSPDLVDDREDSERVDPAAVLDGLPEGERDQELFRYACSLRARNLDKAEAYALVERAGSRCIPPFPEADCRRKVDQAWKYEPGTSPTGLSAEATEWVKGMARGAGDDEAADSTATVEGPTPGALREFQRLLDRAEGQRLYASYVHERQVPDDSDKRVVTGDAIFDEPETVPAYWGYNEAILGACGQGTMLVGQQGVGKTTLAQQLVLHRIGIRVGPLLGLPVVKSDSRVVYLAMDRPTQAMGSFRRMVDTTDRNRELLRERLTIRKGPLPIDPLSEPKALAEYIRNIVGDEAGLIVIDSLKDMAGGRSLSADDVGAGLNSAIQELLAREVEVVILHHQRKAQNGADRTHKLDDVFGSTLLTSGLGSVIALNGNPGDRIMELLHLKQPVSEISEKVQHDHATGTTTLFKGDLDIEDYLRDAGSEGVTAKQWAEHRLGSAADKDIKAARRALTKLVHDGKAVQRPGRRTGGGATPDVWVWRMPGG